jgi:hypothetical protein
MHRRFYLNLVSRDADAGQRPVLSPSPGFREKPGMSKRALCTALSAVIGSVAVCLSLCIPAVFVFPVSVSGEVAIRDLAVLNQSPLFYLNADTADKPLIPREVQEQMNRESDAFFFFPWHQDKPHHGIEHAAWGVKKYSDNPGYGNNGRRRSKEAMRKIIENCGIEDYPQRIFPAISIKNIYFRILPTAERHSDYPGSGGGAFDNFQQSSVPAGTPLLVTLTSRDRKWFLVENRHLIGWVRAADVARVEPAFAKSWENGRYISILKDNTPVAAGSKILYRVPLGTVFPKVGEGAGGIDIWIAGRDSRGYAVLKKAAVPKEDVAVKPLAFTPRNVAVLAGELVGGRYGWGGMNGRRDCSSTVRDIFSPLGLLLPRNSIDQAGAGRFISFMGMSNERKEETIVQKGVPWRTLLWTPGHIMLYIGAPQGKPLIFHNFWKVATLGDRGKEGRLVVGRTAVTTLYPGRELPNIDASRANILSGLAGMTLLGEQNENMPQGPLPTAPLFSGNPESGR